MYPPGHTNCLHHSFDDPAAVQGSEEERLIAFRHVRDQIKTRKALHAKSGPFGFSAFTSYLSVLSGPVYKESFNIIWRTLI